MSDERILERMPDVSRALVAGIMRPRTGIPDDPAALVATGLCVRGSRLDTTRLSAYREICGFSAALDMPVTWPFVWTFPLQLAMITAPSWPLSPAGLVHLGIDFELIRPVLPDDDLSVGCSLGQVEATPRGLEFEMLLSLADDDGPVWSGRSLVLARARKGDRRRKEQNPAPTPAMAEPRPVGAVSASTVTARSYAQVSSDWNPIHIGWLGARLFGYRRPVAHGMWTIARILAELGQGDGARPCRLSAEFRAPYYLPGRMTVRATEAEDGRIDFDGVAVSGGRVLVCGRVG